MKKAHYDAVIIGAGQAGPSLAVRLAQSGQRVAIIEHQYFGGTCVNTGCIPTKTLRASAHAAYLVKRAEYYGIIIDGAINVDMKKVKARKDAIVYNAASGLEAWLRNTPNCTVYHQHAAFIEPYTLQVGDEIITAEKIFLNVGASPFIPPIQGLDTVNYYTNASMMSVDFIPEHLIVIGGSYIGLEFAQMYRRFGSKVSVIEKASRIIEKEDEDVSQAVKEILEDEGIVFYLDSDCLSISSHQDNVVIKMLSSGQERMIEGSHLLLAIGRKPNTHDLGLENTDIDMDEKGYIKVDDTLKTNIKNIWALGECNGRGAFTHTAYNDYEIVASSLFDKEARKVSDRILAYNLYIDPPLGRVGMTEQEAIAKNIKIHVAKRSMKMVKRAVISGDDRGFMKIVVDADTQKILGASILGINGDEVVHSILDTMYADAPYTVIKNAVHIHPTVSELIPTMLNDLA